MTDQPPYPIVRVNVEDADDVETLGTKPKFWWFSASGTRMLFKAEDRGTGEDWAEKISCELCALLQMPHVHYEMAQEYQDGKPKRPGVICENLIESTMSLVLGNQLLFERDNRYPLDARAKYKVRMHTVDAIVTVLGDLGPPCGWSTHDVVASALDVFVGYILLDAWIANQDRHHGNWGAVTDARGQLSLAPTFDHGAALARLLTDSERQERLQTRDRGRSIATYVTKARSACYADISSERTLSSLDCFREFAKRTPDAAIAWQKRLESIHDTQVIAIVDRIPPSRISDVAREFTLELLAENKKRLLQLEIQ